MMRIWNKATNDAWAMTPSTLENILEIANRQNQSPEAVAAKLGKELQNSHTVTIRDNVAIIPVVGPLFRYANLFTQVSGASSYEILAKDFTKALNNEDIKTILFNIDSPGGEVNGCAELAEMIYDARGTKPIIAYASGDAASGAYWIASACDKIYASKTSAIGSIGVVAVYQHDKSDEKTEIISSQSPYKRPDIATDEGKAKIQTRIDNLASVFIEAVAKHRNIDIAKVQSHYGQGDVFIGNDALSQNMIDGITSFEKILSHYNSQTETMKETINMEDTQMTPSVNEKERIATILNSDEAGERIELARHLAFETDIVADEAIEILAKAPISRPDISDFEEAMDNIPNPDITPSIETDENDTDAMAKRLASY